MSTAKTEADPKLLVSVHVAKTGGNTFATVLERAASGLYCQFYGAEHEHTGLRFEDVQLTSDGNVTMDLFDQLLQTPTIRTRQNVLQGHLNARKTSDRYPFADLAVWLRDPVDRVMSHYTFWKRLEVDFPDPLFQRFRSEDMDIETFAAEGRVRNAQTRTTGGIAMDDYAFVGITEEYDRSLGLFGRMYDVDVDDVVQLNFNPEQTGRYDIPDATRRVIESHNDKDMELYKRALERFEHLDATTRQPFRPRRALSKLKRRIVKKARRSSDAAPTTGG